MANGPWDSGQLDFDLSPLLARHEISPKSLNVIHARHIHDITFEPHLSLLFLHAGPSSVALSMKFANGPIP